MKRCVLPALCLAWAACQSPAPRVPAEDSLFTADTLQDSIILPADTLLVKEDSAIAVDSALVPGKWLQPVQGIDSALQGFTLRKNGKALSENMHMRTYEKWRLQRDTLMLWSRMDKDTAVTVDTMVIKELSDTAMVLFPIGAAPGYLEKYTRQVLRKGK
ncbi:lipocalin family protein [Chitinophaga lutea]